MEIMAIALNIGGVMLATLISFPYKIVPSSLFWYISRPFCELRLVLNLEDKKDTYGSPPP